MSRSSRLLSVLGASALAASALLVMLGLWVAPPDAVQGDAQRLMYVHVPAAWLAYVAFFVTAVASALYLWPRTRARRWDRLAGVTAELGVIFTGLALALGMLWGKPIWNVYWTWDARLITTAVLFFLYIGYLALRRIPGDRNQVARRSAVAALIAFVDVPIVHFSVNWWRTQHQQATVLRPDLDPQIHGTMAWTLLWAVVTFHLVFVYLAARRYRLAAIEDHIADEELDLAVVRRRSEDDFVPAERRQVPVLGGGA
ncbi:MAG: cytochrome c biogenesis protein CcsA [Actinobacteria bacterium]|nr:cytochrome c biogenesis protein CcsA [Actinomycetota bacterium]